MTRLHACVLILVLVSLQALSCCAEDSEARPNQGVLSVAQKGEVQRYRDMKSSGLEQQVNSLAERLAKTTQEGKANDQKRSREMLEQARQVLATFDSQTDTDVWRQIEAERMHRGYKWQEEASSSNGKSRAGKWVPLLTASQRDELERWISKEREVGKEYRQMRIERKEAVESGDSGKRRLIDERLLDLKNRVKFPFGAGQMEQWRAVEQEQGRRGLEWSESPSESVQRRLPGKWQPRENKEKQK